MSGIEDLFRLTSAGRSYPLPDPYGSVQGTWIGQDRFLIAGVFREQEHTWKVEGTFAITNGDVGEGIAKIAFYGLATESQLPDDEERQICDRVVQAALTVMRNTWLDARPTTKYDA